MAMDSDGTVRIFENGLVEIIYNISYGEGATADSSAVLTVNNTQVVATKRMLQGQTGVGAVYFYQANAGDEIRVQLSDAQLLQNSNINIYVKYYDISE